MSSPPRAETIETYRGHVLHTFESHVLNSFFFLPFRQIFLRLTGVQSRWWDWVERGTIPNIVTPVPPGLLRQKSKSTALILRVSRHGWEPSRIGCVVDEDGVCTARMCQLYFIGHVAFKLKPKIVAFFCEPLGEKEGRVHVPVLEEVVESQKLSYPKYHDVPCVSLPLW